MLTSSPHNPALSFLVLQGKYDEADPLYLRAIAITEKALGPDHPSLAESLNNRAELLTAQVRKPCRNHGDFCAAIFAYHHHFFSNSRVHRVP